MKREKPIRKIGEGETPFKLRAGWQWSRLEDLSLAVVDCPHSTPEFVEKGLLCIDTNSFKAGKLLPHKLRYVTSATFDDRVARLHPMPGDIVFAREGSVGESLIIPEGTKACLGQRVMLFRFSREVSNEFVRLAITSKAFLKALLDIHKGIGAKHVNVGDMRLAVVPLPPIAEQLRIVARVDELMRICDTLDAKGRLEAAQHNQLVTTLLGTLTDSESPEALADRWKRIAEHFDILLDRPEAVDALEQSITQLAVRGLLVQQDQREEPASALLQRIGSEKERLFAEGKIKRVPSALLADNANDLETLPTGWMWVRMGDLVNASEAGWSPTCIPSPRREGHWGVLKVSAVSWGTFNPDANKELP